MPAAKRDTHVRRKGLSLFVTGGLLLSFVSGAAHADSHRISDANDTPGKLDIRYAAHGHGRGDTVLHTIITYEGWDPSLLAGDDWVALGTDTYSGNKGFRRGDRFVLVTYDQDKERLVANIYKPGDHVTEHFIGTGRAWKPNRRVLKVRVPIRFLGGRDPRKYEWLAQTSFEDGSEDCPESESDDSSYGSCRDRAPNGERTIIHRLTD